MKKFVFFIGFMMFATVAHAENTSWIKGGLSFFNGESFCTNNNPSFGDDPQNRCGDDFDGKNFFIQVSPINIRGKLNDSKFGYRFEPWMGYSQTGDTEVETLEEQEFDGDILEFFAKIKFTKLNVKNFQLGTNLFLDFEVMPDITIYGGPVVGIELSRINAEVTDTDNELNTVTGEFDVEVTDGDIYSSGWSSNFIYGAEVGAEYKITKTVALGTFAGILQHHSMTDKESYSQWNQGSEIRAGTSLTFSW